MKTLSGFIQQNKKQLLALLVITGIAVFWGFVRTPSESQGQFFLGLSFKRLIFASILFLILLLNIIIFWMTSRTGFTARVFNWIHRKVAWVMIAVYFFFLMTALGLWIVFHPVENVMLVDSYRELLAWPALWSFLLSFCLFAIFRVDFRDSLAANRIVTVIDRCLMIAALFLFVYLAYVHLLIWAGPADEQVYTYWNLLADEFLEGRIYLSNPPQTIDLTLYQGKWYVPMPPLPAVMMMPLAYFVGGENIDTRYFSMFLGGINAVIMYLVLEQFSKRQWIKLSLTGILLLVALSVFGTPHLWVGIRGHAWFVSQIVTVTFAGLSVLATLKKWRPWIVGACIGLAIIARPNAIMTWPFVFAIAMQIKKEEQGLVGLNRSLKWSIESFIPALVAIGCLLTYNYMRFGNFFDFGYLTLNGDPTIVENAQRYGILSVHFVPINLETMFLDLPALDLGGRWPVVPSSAGMSIFLTTPAFIYLFHRYERSWWILGAGLSVFLNFVFLVLYHNTGANQFGYRYILDAIFPLLALLAVSFGRKPPWHFMLLLLLSVVMNIYGAYWFINR